MRRTSPKQLSSGNTTGTHIGCEAFFRRWGGTRRTEMLLMVWRIMQGMEIKDVQVALSPARGIQNDSRSRIARRRGRCSIYIQTTLMILRYFGTSVFSKSADGQFLMDSMR